MNLTTIAQLARQLLNEHGLTGWSFQWDRAVRRAGCCKHRYQRITLSVHYASRNADKPDDIKDTLLHEIAHALAGPRQGHGPVWKAICRRIGARPVRCYDSSRVDLPKGRWQATCGGCARVFSRHRNSRRRIWCARCGPERGELRFVCVLVSV